MSHSLSVRGQHGRIKVGYQTAATLTGYSLTPVAPGEWRIEAKVSTTDAFWVTRRPHDLELTVGQQRWIWREATLEIGGGMVSGTVTGRPERR